MSADAYAEYVLSLDPLVYWKCDETSGSTITDYGPFGFNATLAGTLANQTSGIGEFESLIDWDGSTMIATVAHVAANYMLCQPNSTGRFALVFWAAWDAYDGGGYSYLVGNSVGAADNGWSTTFSDGGGHDNVFTTFTSNGTATPHYFATDTIPDGGLHCYILQGDGTNFELFVDGVSQGTVAITIRPAFLEDSLNFGGLEHSGAGNFYHNGLLGQISMHPHALDQSEIDTLYLLGTTAQTIQGNITVGGSPVSHDVVAVEKISGRVVGQTTSDGSGSYSMDVTADIDNDEIYVFQVEDPFVSEPAQIAGPIQADP